MSIVLPVAARFPGIDLCSVHLGGIRRARTTAAARTRAARAGELPEQLGSR